jgi:hypothetical protein
MSVCWVDDVCFVCVCAGLCVNMCSFGGQDPAASSFFLILICFSCLSSFFFMAVHASARERMPPSPHQLIGLKVSSLSLSLSLSVHALFTPIITSPGCTVEEVDHVRDGT